MVCEPLRRCSASPTKPLRLLPPSSGPKRQRWLKCRTTRLTVATFRKRPTGPVLYGVGSPRQGLAALLKTRSGLTRRAQARSAKPRRPTMTTLTVRVIGGGDERGRKIAVDVVELPVRRESCGERRASDRLVRA